MRVKEKKLQRAHYRSDRSYKGEKIESWIVRFEYYGADGIVRKTQPRYPTETKAKAGLKKLIADEATKTGIFAPPPPEPEPEPEIWTFRRLARKYWREKSRTFAKSSRPSRKSEVRELMRYFGDTPLEKIDLSAVDKFKRHIARKPVRVEIKVKSKERILNPSTKRKSWRYTTETRETPRTSSSVNHFLVRLRAMLGFAADRDLMKLPKFSGVIETGNDNRRNLTISFEQLEKLIAACDCKNDYEQRFAKEREELRLLIIGLFETGARLCELQAVKREDISFEHQTMLVPNSKRRPGKAKTYRFVYLSDYLRKALVDAGVENLKPVALVFTQADVKRSFAGAKRRAGIDSSFTLKDLRHCLPSNLGKCRVDELIIEKILGHRQSGLLRTTYINFEQDFLVAEMKKYEKFSSEQRENIVLQAEVVS